MTETERLRPHPQERFAPSSLQFNLREWAAKLRAEPHDAIDGHRQMAIYRHGPVTLLLFAFDRGGELREHQVDGVVTIHVLSGRLTVDAGEVHANLNAGELITLAPGLPHTAKATEGAEAIVTVHRLGI